MPEPLDHLRARRSRRIITSALDDQLAMDGGPVPGHSLFTGCLIEAMTGGLAASTGHRIVTGSEIGHYVQRRVSEYPGSEQTPDFGALELDDRGELLVHIRKEGGEETQPAAVDATIEGVAPGNKPRAPKRRAPSLWVGGGMVMVIVGGAAALFATCNNASAEDVTLMSGGLRDAGVVVVTPPDGALAVATPDAAQPEAINAAVESVPGKTDRKHPQQPSRSRDDASSTGLDRPSIYDRGN